MSIFLAHPVAKEPTVLRGALGCSRVPVHPQPPPPPPARPLPPRRWEQGRCKRHLAVLGCARGGSRGRGRVLLPGGDRHLCETAQVAMVTGGNLGYGLPRASGTRSRASRGIRGHLRRREPGWRPPEPPEPPNCSRKLLQTWQAGAAAGSSPRDGIGLGQSSLL